MKRVIFCLTIALFFGVFSSALQAGPKPFHIAPIQSSPNGQTYSEWAADWWKWAFETPADINPLLDETGENCAAAQTGTVWFLAGTLGPDPVTRECTIRPGTKLFFPLINAAQCAFLTDPPDERTEEFLRSQVACIEDAAISVTIDGVPVSNPEQYLEKSVLFDIQLPEDNLFGATEDDIPELRLTPCADEGFYLFLRPLTPGPHTISWQATSASCGFGQGITYHLTVGNDNAD